ncbi:MAG: glycosyltransferase family 4 protein, partial [Capsulimonadales bacterium]|nr:glycosyltransferase family 4 protein [Capsulimonadales bacterium]
FAGFRADVNNAMNALDVHVLASTWAEPCAAVIQQAMALGKPVIGTDIGGTPEMVVWGETGLLVTPGDAEGLASAIGDLYQDPAKRAWMGEAGSKRVEKLFTLKRMTDRNEALYREILRTKRGGTTAGTG